MYITIKIELKHIIYGKYRTDLLLIEDLKVSNLLLPSVNILYYHPIFKENFFDINLQNKKGKSDYN